MTPILLHLLLLPPLSAGEPPSPGTPVVVHHPASAFPDGVLSMAGYRRNGEVLPAERFQSDEVLVFAPAPLVSNKRPPERILVYFHGWDSHVVGEDGVVRAQSLPSIVACAAPDALLVVPQGPMDLPTSRFGRLETLDGLAGLLDGLPPLLPAGLLPEGWLAGVHHLVLVAHSGGSWPIARILESGRGAPDLPPSRWWSLLDSVILLDASYGDSTVFASWWASGENRWLRSYYVAGSNTEPESKAIAASVGAHAPRVEVEALLPRDLPRGAKGTLHQETPAMRLGKALSGGTSACIP